MISSGDLVGTNPVPQPHVLSTPPDAALILNLTRPSHTGHLNGRGPQGLAFISIGLPMKAENAFSIIIKTSILVSMRTWFSRIWSILSDISGHLVHRRSVLRCGEVKSEPIPHDQLLHDEPGTGPLGFS